ncbi:hypothetical protein [Anabaenopsis elenkinii]|nr:hypothetical protein [Anabaenopsis elenkinii]
MRSAPARRSPFSIPPPFVRLSITRIFLNIRESDRSQTPKP